MSETSGRYDRRNFLLNVSEGAAYVVGASLISSQTVLPALVNKLGGGNIAVGAISVITWAGLFLPQVIASRYGQTLAWKKPWVIGYGTAQRAVVFAIGICLYLFGEQSPAIALGFFFLLFTLNQLLTGLATPVWFDFFAKLTPLEKRGRLTGLRNSAAGTVAFLAGLVLTWLLAAFTFPANYTIVFVVAGGFQFISIALQARLVEEFPSRTSSSPSFRAYARTVLNIMHDNKGFRTFLGASVLLILAVMPMSFFTVYAITKFGASGGDVGTFTLIMVVGQVAGALINGYIADHYGNRLALISAAGAILLATMFALLAPSLQYFFAVYFFVGMNLGSELLIRYNLAIEYGSVEHRSTYVGLMNTVLAPLYLISLLGGWIGNAFGYHAVFALGLLFSVGGIILLLLRVRDPRFHKTAVRPS